ncbi:MAG: hypothetical protein DMF59_19535 [Acidobacteria bacterium]|nr:MAG: hypothetical protein DMF59_19535 [Acidobacteriota bacterium]
MANPITIESEVHDIAMSGDDVILHLYREPYDIVAPKWLPVRTFDGCRIYAVHRDLCASHQAPAPRRTPQRRLDTTIVAQS